MEEVKDLGFGLVSDPEMAAGAVCVKGTRVHIETIAHRYVEDHGPQCRPKTRIAWVVEETGYAVDHDQTEDAIAYIVNEWLQGRSIKDHPMYHPPEEDIQDIEDDGDVRDRLRDIEERVSALEGVLL